MSDVSLEVVEITDHDDGSCTIEVDMDFNTMMRFAKIGLMYVLKSKAMEAIDGHTDAEGEAVPNAGTGSDNDLPEEFPGF